MGSHAQQMVLKFEVILRCGCECWAWLPNLRSETQFMFVFRIGCTFVGSDMLGCAPLTPTYALFCCCYG